MEIPQPEVPQFPPAESTPSDKPPPGDAQIPWFNSQVDLIDRKGPQFGPRKDEFLPYLLVRGASGDRGARPLNGVFWESPDILLAPNQPADSAPLLPPNTGGVANALAPNTLYAHVWNLGKSPAYRVRVEFYWFNPSLGINRSDANLIGAAWIDLSDRFTHYPQWVQVNKSYGQWMTRGCHAIVRCPTTWTPTVVNNGHECLVVRAFEPILDSLNPNQFSAAQDRHVGQRNIAVVQAQSPASVDLALELGYPEAPADAEVEVTLDAPATMEWLQIYTNRRSPGFQAPTAGGIVAGFLPPSAANTRLPAMSAISPASLSELLRQKEKFARGCCPLQIAFHASAANLQQGNAQVLRIRQRADGRTIGGYSVVLLKV